MILSAYPKLSLVFLALMLCSPQLLAQKDLDENVQHKHWLDSSQLYISQQGNNLALWVNRFLGEIRNEQEAPYSTLRLRLDQIWDEEDASTSKIKLRGKIHLPKLSERLSILFSENSDSDAQKEEFQTNEEDAPDDISLQYKAREKKHSRLDLRLGLRSSLKLKTSLRYRYEKAINPSLSGAVSEEVLYLGGEGLASKSQFELNQALSNDHLLHWHNRIYWQENLSGIQWQSHLALDKKISDSQVFGYFLHLNGKTRPEFLTENYKAGVRYRQQIFRPWIFAEIQPAYRWTKASPDDNRESHAYVLIRLEAVFQE